MNKILFKKNYMKWLPLLCCNLIILVILTACQPTPKIPPVISRAGGLPENAIIEPLPDGQVKPLDTPSHWKETMLRGSGKASVEADIDIALPAVSNTPVIELKQKQFDDEQLFDLISYFAGKQKLYLKAPMTKEELTKQLNKMENQEGRYGNPDESYYLAARKNNLRELIERAPKKVNSERKYVTPQFTDPIQTEYHYTRRGEEKDKVKTEKNDFAAIIETGQSKEPYIRATGYNEKAGTTGNFAYSVGGCLDTEDVLVKKENLKRYELEKLPVKEMNGRSLMNYTWKT